MIGIPKLEDRKEVPYIGIRTQVPMKGGMSKAIPKLLKELSRWMKKQNIARAGAPFLRYYVIDMVADVDIEIGIPVAADVKGDERVSPGVLPAGRYASLIFTGVKNGYKGNKALVEWARDNGIAWDRWDDPKGDAFRSRFESYLTDPEIEPDKSKWETEVAIKLADK